VPTDGGLRSRAKFGAADFCRRKTLHSDANNLQGASRSLSLRPQCSIAIETTFPAFVTDHRNRAAGDRAIVILPSKRPVAERV
jgi:hypothetical protein